MEAKQFEEMQSIMDIIYSKDDINKVLKIKL